jgi:hypothetical protein
MFESSYLSLFLLSWAGACKARAQRREAGYAYALIVSFALGDRRILGPYKPPHVHRTYLIIFSAHAVVHNAEGAAFARMLQSNL